MLRPSRAEAGGRGFGGNSVRLVPTPNFGVGTRQKAEAKSLPRSVFSLAANS